MRDQSEPWMYARKEEIEAMTFEEAVKIVQAMIDRGHTKDDYRPREHLTKALEIILGSAKPKYTSVKEGLPNAPNGQYICRYIYNDFPGQEFYIILEWYGTDEVPHFQDEGHYGMRITHWMPLQKV